MTSFATILHLEKNEINIHSNAPKNGNLIVHGKTLDTMENMKRSSLAAFVSAGFTCALFNPLDCLRTRWQVIPRNQSLVLSNGLVRFGIDIVNREGLIQGLWRPGLAPNVIGMASSAALRFGIYETVRDGILPSSTNSFDNGEYYNIAQEKSVSHMLFAGIICGALGYSLSTPFHLLKTVNQARRSQEFPIIQKSISFQTILNKGGFLGLWRGSIPLACRGAFFTSGQMLGYDGMKTFGKEQFHLKDGILLHICSSIVASFGASSLSAPADLIMTNYMANHAKSKRFNFVGYFKDVLAEEGILGFWRGWQLSFVKLTPVMLIYSTLYEEARFQLGIGYLS